MHLQGIARGPAAARPHLLRLGHNERASLGRENGLCCHVDEAAAAKGRVSRADERVALDRARGCRENPRMRRVHGDRRPCRQAYTALALVVGGVDCELAREQSGEIWCLVLALSASHCSRHAQFSCCGSKSAAAAPSCLLVRLAPTATTSLAAHDSAGRPSSRKTCMPGCRRPKGCATG